MVLVELNGSGNNGYYGFMFVVVGKMCSCWVKEWELFEIE